jgi:methionyl-tRNA formyltransferase
MGNTINNYILLTAKSWHNNLFEYLQTRPNELWTRISSKEDFNIEKIKLLNPIKIFIPHWSYIISKEIFENYRCIVFHMTDLPFGRGGSPLQNLIIRGLTETKISAIKVNEGIDTGDIYVKETLSLNGTATEIFERSVPIIQSLIEKIIDEQIEPKSQFGELVVFKRRRPEESNISALQELEEVYDYIRMLDCEGYPNAFVETENFKFDFSNAQFNTEQNCINANVRIFKK